MLPVCGLMTAFRLASPFALVLPVICEPWEALGGCTVAGGDWSAVGFDGVVAAGVGLVGEVKDGVVLAGFVVAAGVLAGVLPTGGGCSGGSSGAGWGAGAAGLVGGGSVSPLHTKAYLQYICRFIAQIDLLTCMHKYPVPVQDLRHELHRRTEHRRSVPAVHIT